MSKEKISVTLGSEQVGEISELVGDEYESRSEAVRELIDRGFQYEALERERDRLQEQLAAVNSRQDEVTEIVEYVDEERSWRSAPIWQRAKWWVFGQSREA